MFLIMFLIQVIANNKISFYYHLMAGIDYYVLIQFPYFDFLFGATAVIMEFKKTWKVVS